MYEISQGSGRHRVLLRIFDTGSGWVGSLTGGDSPHVGGVVLAVPRASLRGAGRSADVWSIPVPGHLDHEAAAPLVKLLCVRLDAPVSLSCGIHMEHATAEDIGLVVAHCEAAVGAFLQALNGDAAK